jgi:hypothetical protein
MTILGGFGFIAVVLGFFIVEGVASGMLTFCWLHAVILDAKTSKEMIEVGFFTDYALKF